MNAELPRKEITITRETANIFVVRSNYVFWSNGEKLAARVAFDAKNMLSSIHAQSIDRKLGMTYDIITPVGIKHPAVLSAAKGLGIGEFAIVTI